MARTLVWTMTSLLSVALLSGCQDGLGRLEGQVVDLAGQPLQARVSIEGLEGGVWTDATGDFELPYPPGRFTVTMEASGHLPARTSWDLSSAVDVAAAPTALAPRPPSPGAWATQGREVKPLVRSSPTVRPEALGGFFAAYREWWSVDGEGQAWCAGSPLLVGTGASASDPPEVAAWQVGPTGRLWPVGIPPAPAQRVPLEVSALAEGVWRVDPPQPSGTVALTVGDVSALTDTWLFLMQVEACADDAASGSAL